MEPDEIKYEESKLLSLLAEDSEYAFQLIYDRHRNRVYQTGIRFLKSPLLAQDLVQDVFLKLWLERKQLKKGQAIEAWLYTVAKNNLLNRIKKIANDWKAAAEIRFTTSLLVNNTDGKIKDAQYNALLQKLITSLPEQQQKVFQLARHEQLSYREIGERMGISALTVKTHMQRALNHIKSSLAKHGEILISLSTLLFPNLFCSDVLPSLELIV